jgi:hypothetical protein
MSLPDEKKEKLKEQVADEAYEHWRSKEADLVKHEVSTKDAKDIVVGGLQKAADKWNEEESK